MDQSRTDTLRTLLAQDAGNTFVRYGLAMEFVKSGEYETAVREFEELLKHDPDYAAAYYHGGQALEKAGKLPEAEALYRRGIEVCTRIGDAHTRSELEAALAIL